jgi:hypothetical protein
VRTRSPIHFSAIPFVTLAPDRGRVSLDGSNLLRSGWGCSIRSYPKVNESSPEKRGCGTTPLSDDLSDSHRCGDRTSAAVLTVASCCRGEPQTEGFRRWEASRGWRLARYRSVWRCRRGRRPVKRRRGTIRKSTDVRVATEQRQLVSYPRKNSLALVATAACAKACGCFFLSNG